MQHQLVLNYTCTSKGAMNNEARDTIGSNVEGKKKKQHFSLRRFPVSEHLGASLCVGPPRRHPGPGGLQLFPCCGSSLCDFVFALAKVEAAAPAPHLHPAPPPTPTLSDPLSPLSSLLRRIIGGAFVSRAGASAMGGIQPGTTPQPDPPSPFFPHL